MEDLQADIATQARLIRYAINEKNAARDDITLRRLQRIEDMIKEFIEDN